MQVDHQVPYFLHCSLGAFAGPFVRLPECVFVFFGSVKGEQVVKPACVHSRCPEFILMEKSRVPNTRKNNFAPHPEVPTGTLRQRPPPPNPPLDLPPPPRSPWEGGSRLFYPTEEHVMQLVEKDSVTPPPLFPSENWHTLQCRNAPRLCHSHAPLPPVLFS